MFILLTGAQHAGKTTACWKALPGLRATGVKMAGFVSPPILDERRQKDRHRNGRSDHRQAAELCRVVGPDESPTIGVYQVVEGATEWARGVLSAALLANVDWLVIDEIGPLELHRA